MSLLSNIGGAINGAIGGIGNSLSGYFAPKSTAQVTKNMPFAGGYMKHMQEIKDLEGSLKKGGPIKKTGIYKLHKGERVLNEKQTKSYMKKDKKSSDSKSVAMAKALGKSVGKKHKDIFNSPEHKKAVAKGKAEYEEDRKHINYD